MNDNNKEQQGLQLELPQEVAQGEYANFAIITHSSSDFIIDFARVLPGVPKAAGCPSGEYHALRERVWAHSHSQSAACHNRTF